MATNLTSSSNFSLASVGLKAAIIPITIGFTKSAGYIVDPHWILLRKHQYQQIVWTSLVGPIEIRFDVFYKKYMATKKSPFEIFDNLTGQVGVTIYSGRAYANSAGKLDVSIYSYNIYNSKGERLVGDPKQKHGKVLTPTPYDPGVIIEG